MRSRWHDGVSRLRPAGWSICRDWISAFGVDGRLIFGDLAAGVCLEIGGRKNVVNLFTVRGFHFPVVTYHALLRIFFVAAIFLRCSVPRGAVEGWWWYDWRQQAV